MSRKLLRRTVGDLVAEDYARATTFQSFGIDFCCGGDRTLAQACDEAAVSPEAVLRALEGAKRGRAREQDVRTWDPAQLVGHIVDVHHGYVREIGPVLRDLVSTTTRVHGDDQPELEGVRGLVEDLLGELERHMEEEEREVFPLIAAASQGASSAHDDLSDALRTLRDDHEQTGMLLLQLRTLTDGYTAPDSACATYRAAYGLLEELDADIQRHVHLENNVLFPGVVSFASSDTPEARRPRRA